MACSRITQPGEQPLIHLLDEIISALIQAVDRMLVRSDRGIGGGRVAGKIFFMPQIEVGAVIGHGEFAEGGRIGQRVDVGRTGCVMPIGSRLVVQPCYRGEFGHTMAERSDGEGIQMNCISNQFTPPVSRSLARLGSPLTDGICREAAKQAD